MGKDGGNAFPDVMGNNSGLTKREWLAGLAMQGLIVHGTFMHETAEKAVKYADALLKELGKEGPDAV